jgi:hypothetical protein
MKKCLSKYFGFLFLVAALSSCSGAAGPGGAASPLGGPGGAGGYGAPPISMPGPVALNMTDITVTSDGGGTATVNVSPGAGTPGETMHVRNLGPVAWYRPIKDLFLRTAYAMGETVTEPIGNDGATTPPSFTIPAAIGDWLEFKQCSTPYPGLCSAGFKIQVKLGVSSGGSATPSSPPSKMTVDPGKGIIYYMWNLHPKKDWNWTSLFISSAYASEGSAADLGNPPSPIPTGAVLSPPVGLTDRYTAATCSLLPSDYQAAPTRFSEGSSCNIRRVDSTGQPETLIQIPNCDPKQGNLYYYEQGPAQKLAVWSGNTLWVVNLSTTATIEGKWVYWSNIQNVQLISDGITNGNLFVTLDVRPGMSLPVLAINHDCVSPAEVPALAGATKIDGFMGTGSSFVMATEYGPQSCLLFGSSGEIVIGGLAKDNNTCQSTPLIEPTVLKTDVCGLYYLALSPDTNDLIFGFHVSNMGTDCSSRTRISKIRIPTATRLVSLAVGIDSRGRGDKIAVLDSPADSTGKAQIFPFQIVGATDGIALEAMMPVDLGASRPTLIRFSAVGTPDESRFVTNTVDTQAGTGYSTYRSTDFHARAMPVLGDGIHLPPSGLLPPTPSTSIH